MFSYTSSLFGGYASKSSKKETKSASNNNNDNISILSLNKKENAFISDNINNNKDNNNNTSELNKDNNTSTYKYTNPLSKPFADIVITISTDKDGKEIIEQKNFKANTKKLTLMQQEEIICKKEYSKLHQDGYNSMCLETMYSLLFNRGEEKTHLKNLNLQKVKDDIDQLRLTIEKTIRNGKNCCITFDPKSNIDIEEIC